MGSSKDRWLNQSTHSKVANSTTSRVRHGPRRRITSCLVEAVDGLGQGVIVAVTDAAHRGFGADFG